MPGQPCVLVAGGAGYIGSHMVRMLQDEGWRPVVVDNLATGHARAAGDAPLCKGDIGDPRFMAAVLREYRPACVMHFAGASLVDESVANPAKYWRHNVVQTLNLLDTMIECGVRQLIYTSTAAVYGNPAQVPVSEDHPTLPLNPYGRSKLAVEHALADYGRAYGLRHFVFRHFNAAGAHPGGTLGEMHEPETHLIPLVLQVASGRREFIARFGNQFPTRDGSCIRDYVHVQDLCEAHLLGLRKLGEGAPGGTFNLGNGLGHSVNEVIDTARRVTGHPIPVRDEPARHGDPPALVADATRAREELGWTPRYPGIETIVAHAWPWEQRLAR